MSVLALPLMIIGTTLSAVSLIQQGKQQEANTIYNASVADVQSKSIGTAAEFESETLKEQNKFERSKILREKQRTLSIQRARFAKAGIRLDEGTPIDIMADTAAQYELDLAANEYNVQVGLEEIRYDTDVQRARLGSEAQYQRQLGKSQRRASYLGAGSTLLTGYGRASNLIS